MIFRQRKLEETIREAVADALHDHDTAEAEDLVDDLFDDEVERRKWCIDQAVYLDDMRIDDLFKAADRIYEYVFGKKSI